MLTVSARACRAGDTLFALGCGRLFEGTPKQMWQVRPDATMFLHRPRCSISLCSPTLLHALSVSLYVPHCVRCSGETPALLGHAPAAHADICWPCVLLMPVRDAQDQSIHVIIRHSICSHFPRFFRFGRLLGPLALA